MTLHRVFIFQPSQPTRKIIELDAQILTLEKRTWAETASGKRHLLGSSAFYTLAAAERAKRGALLKITETTALRRMPTTQHLVRNAESQLAIYDQLGTFNPKGKPN
mgnify:CR=1 FL=1